jgi:acyl-[acyl-carrier-protein]-phospholipid O-acyltransferase/long-chain-fatty-acid--[acyl-carrier-protein] ligase
MFFAFMRLLIRALYRVRVEGELRPAAKLLIVANHQSFLDAPLLWAVLPLEPVWLVHTTVARHWYFRVLLRAVPHLLVDTGSPFSMKAAAEAIEAGRPMIIFPEGRITATGALMKIYEGPAFVAARTGATIVPVIIDGATRARGFTRLGTAFPKQWLPRIRVTIRPPRHIETPAGISAKERRRLAGAQLRRIMQESLVEARERTTLGRAFLDRVSWFGRGRPLLEDATGNEFTYGRLLKASLVLGRVLARFTSPGEAVGVLLPNVGATPAVIWGLIGYGRVPAMLNFSAGADAMQSAIRAARVRLVITSRLFLERGRLQPLVDQLDVERILYLEDVRAMVGPGDKLWLLLYALWAPGRVFHRPKETDPAVVLFTSGSEGKPKGVVISHATVLANIAQVLTVYDLGPVDKLMAALPMFHSFGLLGGLLVPVLTGAQAFLYPTPLHYRIIPELTYDRDCTVLFATNTFLGHYARRAHPWDFRSVRYVVAGAEKLTPEVRSVYQEKFGVRVMEGYGATECGPVLSANCPAAAKPGTVGQLMPCLDHRIEPVPGIDDGGLLHVRGPNMMLGYWKEDRPAELQWPESCFGAGWYPTGDIVSIDEDGFVRLLGRARRFAKVAGEMISLEVVEMIAERASPKKLHAAMTLPDRQRGELIVLCTCDGELRRDQLQHAARQLGSPDLAVPRRLIMVDQVPLLGNGKKDYPALARMLAEMEEQSAAAAAEAE